MNDNDIDIDIDVSCTGDNGSSADEKKVTLCHNGETIEVSMSALEAHYGHGDTLGPCPEPVTPVEPEPIETPEPVTPEPVPVEPVTP